MVERKCIGVDPGGDTGWAIRDIDQTWRHGVFDEDDHHNQLWEFLYQEHFNKGASIGLIVCERFNYQRRPLDKGVSVEIISREYIGVVKLFTQTYRVPLYMAQVPNKDFFNDANLKKLGMWYGTQHERDAAAHLLWYFTNIEGDHQYLWSKKP